MFCGFSKSSYMCVTSVPKKAPDSIVDSRPMVSVSA